MVAPMSETDREIAATETRIRLLEQQLENTRRHLEDLRNRPQDTYDDGTYLILEYGTWFKAYLRDGGKWYAPGQSTDANPGLPWAVIARHMRTATTYRVVEMQQEV